MSICLLVGVLVGVVRAEEPAAESRPAAEQSPPAPFYPNVPEPPSSTGVRAATPPATQKPPTGNTRSARPATTRGAPVTGQAPAGRGRSAADSGSLNAAPVTISGQFAQGWQSGSESIWLVRGNAVVTQGNSTASAKEMILWRRTDTRQSPPVDRLQVYLEGDAQLDHGSRTSNGNRMLIELITRGGVSIDKRARLLKESAEEEAIFQRALAYRESHHRARPNRRPEVLQAGHQPALLPPGLNGPEGQMDPEADGPVLLDDAPVQGEEEVEMHSLQLDQPQGGLRRIRVFPRSAVQFSVESFENKETAPPEQVWLISGGVNLLIDGINLQTGPIGSGSSQGPVDLSADRIVIWTLMGGGESDLQGEGTLQSTETPMQIYLEGNIVIRQGQNTMRAARAFYDARDNRALLLNAELKTKLPQVGGDVRIRANEIRQLAEQTYEAKSAWISTSQFGQPGYRMQADSIFIEPWEEDWIYRSRERDPETGELIDPPTLWATSQNNTFYLNQYPLMYFPSLTFPAEDPNIPLRNIRFGNDQVLGTQLYTTWNLFKLIGVRRPNNTRLDLHADYLTKRGLEGGLTGSYAGANRFTENDRYEGKGLGFYIRDQGLDNLGSDRRSLPLQQSDRGRINIWDRQRFADGHTLYTEFGYVSDRNVLEQYDEQAFDLSKDYETMVYLSRNVDNWAYTAAIRPRMYNYYNESEYLPKGDFYLLGQPFMDGWMSYSTHTTAGYATQKIADAPFDPSLDIYSVLPYEGNASGVLLSTRHQIDTVFNLGPARIMPYALGEASYWGQDYTGNSLDRLYGVGGVRSSLEFWKVFPDVENGLMNVSGLAHKATLFADYSYAYANRSLAGIPQFNEFDDNSQEQFHRRLLYNTFGGTVPPQFQSREFAVRTGAAQSVTAPYYELVDTRQALRFGIQQRLQTKRGPVNDQRIVDWMTLDLETTFFPDAQRDNFGQQFGLYGGRYNWYVGDRTSITANAYFDTFDQAQRLWSVGINSYRGSRGLVYLGYRQIEAFNFRSQIVTAFYTYQHSPKWSSTIMTAYDVGQQQNLGQSITLTRTGADFLVHLGLIVDPTKSNVGVGVSVEPRFLQLSNSLGQMNNFLSGGQNR